MSCRGRAGWLRQAGRRYIIGAPKVELCKFAAELAVAYGKRLIRDGIEVKLVSWPDTAEKAILCRSADWRSKKQAMHEKFSARIKAALASLAEQFQIVLTAADCPAGMRLHVARDPAFDDWAAVSEGAYVLRTHSEASARRGHCPVARHR